MQIKTILKQSFIDDEIKYLTQNASNTSANELSLACTILLERKIEVIQKYNTLSDESRGKFDEWPLKYLHDDLIK